MPLLMVRDSPQVSGKRVTMRTGRSGHATSCDECLSIYIELLGKDQLRKWALQLNLHLEAEHFPRAEGLSTFSNTLRKPHHLM